MLVLVQRQNTEKIRMARVTLLTSAYLFAMGLLYAAYAIPLT
jgi:hypothetical protein